MIELPDKKKCYNLPEQVAQNLRNITFLAEQYKNIDELPAIWQTYKEEFDRDLETFGDWTTTFEGWDNTLSTYLANMSSAAVGAIAGQTIAPANVAATGNITADSIVENMTGYNFTKNTTDANWTPVYVGVCKNGNKITFVVFGTITRDSAHTGSIVELGQFTIPSSVGTNLYPAISYVLDWKFIPFITGLADASPVTLKCVLDKNSNTNIGVRVFSHTSLTLDQLYYFRIEVTFLLSQNYAS